MAPNNTLAIYGNEKTMNLNTLVLTNIQASPYFKIKLYNLKTYHEVIDEIYYKVTHLEAWERGSRKIAGQTGMCGGVRGVGTGGVVSSAYCLLFKLFTMKLTRKQVNGLLTHGDSPFIRGLGFMYLRYTLPPSDLWDWFIDYFEDEEEVDPKAGGGGATTIGAMAMSMLTKLDWYGTLFPRIPVPIQKSIATNMEEYLQSTGGQAAMFNTNNGNDYSNNNRASSYDSRHSESNRHSNSNLQQSNRNTDSENKRFRSPPEKRNSPANRKSPERSHHRHFPEQRHNRHRSPSDEHRHREHKRTDQEHRRHRSRSPERHHHKSRHHRHHRSSSRDRNRSHKNSHDSHTFDNELRRAKQRIKSRH